MQLFGHNAKNLKTTQLWKDQLLLNLTDPLDTMNTDRQDLDTVRPIHMDTQTEEIITLESVKLNPNTSEDT